MLYIDKLVYAKTGLTYRFETDWQVEDVYGLIDTHEKSSNWNEIEDGLWEKLLVGDIN